MWPYIKKYNRVRRVELHVGKNTSTHSIPQVSSRLALDSRRVCREKDNSARSRQSTASPTIFWTYSRKGEEIGAQEAWRHG